MGERVHAHLVALRVHSAYQVGSFGDTSTEDEERRLHPVRGQDVEDLRGPLRRSVVEGQDHVTGRARAGRPAAWTGRRSVPLRGPATGTSSAPGFDARRVGSLAQLTARDTGRPPASAGHRRARRPAPASASVVPSRSRSPAIALDDYFVRPGGVDVGAELGCPLDLAGRRARVLGLRRRLRGRSSLWSSRSSLSRGGSRCCARAGCSKAWAMRSPSAAASAPSQNRSREQHPGRQVLRSPHSAAVPLTQRSLLRRRHGGRRAVASWLAARRTAGPSTEPGFAPAVRPASRALPPSAVASRAAPGALSEVGGASPAQSWAAAPGSPSRSRRPLRRGRGSAHRPRAAHCRTVTRRPDSSVNTGVFARSVSTRGLHSGQGATTHDFGPH